MAGNLIPLNEAAKMLGKSVEELTELRSQNEISGYRDGSSWKFKIEEIYRFADDKGIELVASEMEEDLSSDVDLIADSAAEISLDDIDGEIDLGTGDDASPAPNESHILSGSDVEPGNSPSDTGKMVEGDDDLLLAEDDLFGDDNEVSDQVDSDELILDSDSELSSDFDDDSSLMLDDDSSEIALDAADSGVNLSPTDSGLSLDEEPLELGGSDIDALELPEDSEIDLLNSGDDSSIMDDDLNPVNTAANSGAVQSDNDFMLTPLEGDGEDESSGSQVIALEDSEIYADESSDIVSDSSQLGGGPLLEEAGAPMFEEAAPMAGVPEMASSSSEAAPAGQVMIEQPIPIWMVAIQSICLLFLLAAGVIVIDLARNMFEFNDGGEMSRQLTDHILDFTGYFKNA
jgi:hypothetical protein